MDFIHIIEREKLACGGNKKQLLNIQNHFCLCIPKKNYNNKSISFRSTCLMALFEKQGSLEGKMERQWPMHSEDKDMIFNDSFLRSKVVTGLILYV